MILSRYKVYLSNKLNELEFRYTGSRSAKDYREIQLVKAELEYLNDPKRLKIMNDIPEHIDIYRK